GDDAIDARAVERDHAADVLGNKRSRAADFANQVALADRIDGDDAPLDGRRGRLELRDDDGHDDDDHGPNAVEHILAGLRFRGPGEINHLMSAGWRGGTD